MSLPGLVGAVGGASAAGAGAPVSDISLSAPFNDISDPAGGGATLGNTVTVTVAGGGPANINVTTASGGTVGYSVNGAAFVNLVAGAATFAVSTGDTVQFRLASTGADIQPVYLNDDSAILIDEWEANCEA